MPELIGQILGIVGLIVTVLSYQFKKMNTVMMLQIFSCLCFTVSFILIGSIASAIMNGISIVRSIIFSIEKTKTKFLSYISMQLMYMMGVIIAYFYVTPKWMIIFVALASFISTYAIWTNNPAKFRIIQVLLVSPLWITNNIFVFSIGGILTESFNIVSIAVYFIRQKMIKKDDKLI